MTITLNRARAAKEKAFERFKGIGEVVGVGITRVDGNYAVKVNLSAAPARNAVVPTQIDGVPVRVAVVGPIRTLA
jgi:hypothetical protein